MNGILGSVTCKDKYVYFKYGEDIDLEYHFSEDPDNDEIAVNHVDTSKNRYSRAVDVDDRVMGVFENFFYSLAINYSMQALVPQDYWNELACGDNKDDNPENSWLDPIKVILSALLGITECDAFVAKVEKKWLRNRYGVILSG